MSSTDQTPEKNVAAEAAPPAEASEAQGPEAKADDAKVAEAGDAAADVKETESSPKDKPTDTAEKPAESVEKAEEKAEEKIEEKADESADVEMKDATEEASKEVPAAASAPDAEAEAKAKAARRKSSGTSEPKGKKLNKKQSKARILNLDAQPGDHYLVKLKGYPAWPAVICDEAMLPQQLLATRPVTAKRADGTYREDFADGGKRVNDRTFPVMYLHTNEFGYVPNTSLQELSPEQATAAINDKMRKDLQAAFELAAEGNDLDYYKELLQNFQEEMVAKAEAKKAKKAKPSKLDDMDIDDVDDATPAKKSKKRKAEDVATPQRSDSVKKPKIKLMSSAAKAANANGAGTPKAKDQSVSKSTKSKSKKSADAKAETPVPKKPELTPAERQQRRVKEVLYLRHKLQKGFFTKDQEPKEEEMQTMSDFFTRLEAFTEMDTDILKETRIHKVPKAIIRLASIPREAEFNFKSRSQALLDQWNKLLVADSSAPAATEGPSNGVNGAKEIKEQKSVTPGANGAEGSGEKPAAEGADKAEEKTEANTEEKVEEKSTEDKTEPPSEEAKAPEPVEAAA